MAAVGYVRALEQSIILYTLCIYDEMVKSQSLITSTHYLSSCDEYSRCSGGFL